MYTNIAAIHEKLANSWLVGWLFASGIGVVPTQEADRAGAEMPQQLSS